MQLTSFLRNDDLLQFQSPEHRGQYEHAVATVVELIPKLPLGLDVNVMFSQFVSHA